MRTTIMAAFLALLAVPGLVRAAEGQAGSITIEQPWARASVTSSGAAYLTIKNAGEADRLTGAATPLAAKAEVHTTVDDGGIMKMRPAMPLAIPAHGSVVFKPQGLHVMLTGLKGPLKAGETLPLTLHFEKAGDIAVSVPIQQVRASGPGGMEGMDHEHMMDHSAMPMDHQQMAPQGGMPDGMPGMSGGGMSGGNK